MRWKAVKLGSKEQMRKRILEHLSNLTALNVGLLVGAILKHILF